MARKKAQQTLHVYLNGLSLGILAYKAKSNLTFVYRSEWLQRPNAFPISRSLPLREESYEGANVYAYFDNLLPDGISIRQRIAARMHAQSDHVFDLLEVVGRDCVGALQFVKPTDKAPVLENPTGTPVNESEIAAKLRRLRSAPLGVSDEEDFRLSIAGAQEKTAFLKLNKKWHVPLRATPTTHIFKPQIGEIRPGLSFVDSVENEWLCAKIVEAFGLRVTDCEIQSFEDIKVLIVERFDRAWIVEKLIRVPQEDMCQALGVPSFKKYENDGGPGIVQIMDILNESTNREEDRIHFMKAQVVFLLLAAIDGHAKNFSMTWRPSGFRLTSIYDILSAYPLLNNGSFQSERLKMAMSFGDKRKYRLSEIYRRHILQTAKRSRFEVNVTNQIIDQTLEEVPKVIDTVSKLINDKFPGEVADAIFSGMKERRNNFRI